MCIINSNIIQLSKQLLMAFFVIAMVATSCSEVDCEQDPNNPECAPTSSFTVEEVIIDGTAYQKVSGNFDEDYTFDANTNWLLSGGVFVDDGTVLTIEAGTTVIAADDGSDPFLVISQGAKIIADGTADAPIVFTTIKANPSAGDWGGLIINGKAPVNCGDTCESEGGAGTYGGTASDDDSGILRYVRIEYGGKKFTTEDELNGFTFNGVGNSTIVEYIQAYECADDGIEFFGGTVNVKYAVVSNAGDDSFDWAYGWVGNGQFWVAVQSEVESDRAIEGDNNKNDRVISPASNPTIANCTFIGANDDGDNQAMKLREGTKATIHNAICLGFPKRGVQVEHNETVANMNDGSLLVANSIIAYTNANDNYKYFLATDTDGNEVTCTFANDASNSTGVSNFGIEGYRGTVNENAADPTTLGNWFDAATYIGAVPTGSDWTIGWTK